MDPKDQNAAPFVKSRVREIDIRGQLHSDIGTVRELTAPSGLWALVRWDSDPSQEQWIAFPGENLCVVGVEP